MLVEFLRASYVIFFVGIVTSKMILVGEMPDSSRIVIGAAKDKDALRHDDLRRGGVRQSC